MLVSNEDWAELDKEHAVALMDDSLRAAQATRARTGSEQISLDNVDNRVTVMTMGLATNAPEGAPLRDYLFGLPAYQRIDEQFPLLTLIAAGMAGVEGRHAQAFEELDRYAWKTGLGLGLLDLIGELPDDDRLAELLGET